MGNRSHVGIRELVEINWIPVRARFEQNVTTHISKQQIKLAPKYMDEMFTSADHFKIKTRSSLNKLIQPHCNRESGYKAISSLGQKLWNKLPCDIKTAINPTSFKHKVTMHYLEALARKDYY